MLSLHKKGHAQRVAQAVTCSYSLTILTSRRLPRAGVGGLIVDGSGVPLRFFSDQVSDRDLDVLLQEFSHPIYAVKLFAVMIAMSAWEDLLYDTFTVVFVDNTAAQAALVAGKSSTVCGRRILQQVLNIEQQTANRPWFGWVPSYSNPSDPPSKLLGSSFILLVGRSLQFLKKKQSPSYSEEAVTISARVVWRGN